MFQYYSSSSHASYGKFALSWYFIMCLSHLLSIARPFEVNDNSATWRRPEWSLPLPDILHRSRRDRSPLLHTTLWLGYSPVSSDVVFLSFLSGIYSEVCKWIHFYDKAFYFFLDLHWVIGRNFGTKEITKYQERNLFFRFFILSYLMFVKMNNSEVIKWLNVLK